MCYYEHTTDSSRNYVNLPPYGWWYYCIICSIPTYHENRICNTCRRNEKIRKRT